MIVGGRPVPSSGDPSIRRLDLTWALLARDPMKCEPHGPSQEGRGVGIEKLIWILDVQPEDLHALLVRHLVDPIDGHRVQLKVHSHAGGGVGNDRLVLIETIILATRGD